MRNLTSTVNPLPLSSIGFLPLISIRFQAGSLFLIALACSFSAQATIFNYDLRGDAAALALDGKNTGRLLSHGLTATFVAGSGSSVNAIFNQTASRFGINSLPTSGDSPSLIDSVGGVSEFLNISFDRIVMLDRLTLSSFAPGEIAGVSVAASPSVLLNGMTMARDVYTFSGLTLDPGEPIMLSHIAGNGFSFDAISLHSVAVAEPGTFMLILTGVCAMVVFRRGKGDRIKPVPFNAIFLLTAD